MAAHLEGDTGDRGRAEPMDEDDDRELGQLTDPPGLPTRSRNNADEDALASQLRQQASLEPGEAALAGRIKIRNQVLLALHPSKILGQRLSGQSASAEGGPGAIDPRLQLTDTVFASESVVLRQHVEELEGLLAESQRVQEPNQPSTSNAGLELEARVRAAIDGLQLLAQNYSSMATSIPGMSSYAHTSRAKSATEIMRHYGDSEKCLGDSSDPDTNRTCLAMLISKAQHMLDACHEPEHAHVVATGHSCLKGQAYNTFVSSITDLKEDFREHGNAPRLTWEWFGPLLTSLFDLDPHADFHREQGLAELDVLEGEFRHAHQPLQLLMNKYGTARHLTPRAQRMSKSRELFMFKMNLPKVVRGLCHRGPIAEPVTSIEECIRLRSRDIMAKLSQLRKRPADRSGPSARSKAAKATESDVSPAKPFCTHCNKPGQLVVAM